MEKATVKGVVEATSESIGGFSIGDGIIGAGSSDEMDDADGLALLKNFIRFSKSSTYSKQRVLLGCLSSLGYPFNGLMELTGIQGTTLQLHHKYERTSDEEKYEHINRPKALEVFGNQFNVGKVALFEKGYIGTAYSDTVEKRIGITHKFLFTGADAAYVGIHLPVKADIDEITGNAVVQFDLEIVCDRSMPNKVQIMSEEGATIYDNNGNATGGIDLVRGDALYLRYYDGGWNMVFLYNK